MIAVTSENAREAYGNFTRAASEVSRQLCFGALAFVWILKGEGPAASAPPDLLAPMIAAAAALACDFSQYIYLSLLWATAHRVWERRVQSGQEDRFAMPRAYLAPSWILFWGKLALTSTTYLLLFQALFRRWSDG